MAESSKKTNIFFTYYLFPAITFIALILILGYHNRFASDDFLIIDQSNQYSPLEFAVSHYLRWQGTFFISFCESWAFHFMQEWRTLLIFHAVSLVLLIHAAYIFLKNFLYALLQAGVIRSFEGQTTPIPVSLLMLTAISMCCCFFFMSHDLGQQSWFLISGATRYFWPLILLLYATSFAFHTAQDKIKTIAACILFFIFGFSTPNYVLIILFIYALALTFLKKDRAYIMPFVFLLAGATLMFAAPGNYKRRELYDFAATTGEIASTTAASVIYFIKVMIKLKLVYALLFVMIFSVTAFYLRAKKKLTFRQVFFSIPVTCFLIILIAGIIHASLMSMAMGRAGPHRTFLLLSLIFTLAIIVWGFCLGNYLMQVNPKINQCIFFAGTALIGITNTKLLIEQYPIVSNYAKAFDKQIEYLQQLNDDNSNHGRNIYLPALPPSGMLYQLELATDTSDRSDYGITKAFEEVYGLKVNIFQKK